MALERKNIEDLTPNELAVYEHAIQIMKSRTDPENNYTYHANLHNKFSNNPPHGCEHANDLFLPWHRYHLFNFERELRLTDPNHPSLSTKDLTIPFWDWSRPPRSGGRYPAAFERGDSVLFDDFRVTESAGPMYDAEFITSILRDNSDFHKFAGGPKDGNSHFGALELPAHNDMHSAYIQGDMGDPNTAAEDPIYWSFHCFIDRLWSRWTRIHGIEPSFQNGTLRGFKNSPNAADMVSEEALGYFYSFTPEEIAPQQPSEGGALALGEPPPDEVEIVAQQIGEGLSTYRIKAPQARFNDAELWLTGLMMPSTLSYRLETYIYPSGGTFDPAADTFREEYFAGYYSFWRGHTGMHGETHAHRVGAFIPVQEALRRILERHPAAEYNLALVAREVRPAPGRAPQPPARPLTDEVQFQSVVLALNGAVPSPAAHDHGGHHGGHGHGE